MALRLDKSIHRNEQPITEYVFRKTGFSMADFSLVRKITLDVNDEKRQIFKINMISEGSPHVIELTADSVFQLEIRCKETRFPTGIVLGVRNICQNGWEGLNWEVFDCDENAISLYCESIIVEISSENVQGP